ncbi:hypothetical protein DL96DRAFT_1751730 [Flagelloscypha sp. PMI_526]|nr:hypothetical protein DL96DRAFT_1751730 [Flagelloscypha sp. PMI_526]
MSSSKAPRLPPREKNGNSWQEQYTITPPSSTSVSPLNYPARSTSGSSSTSGNATASSSSSGSSGSQQSGDYRSYTLVSKEEEARQESNLHRSTTSATLPPAYSEEADFLPPPPMPPIFEPDTESDTASTIAPISRVTSFAASTTVDRSSVYSLPVTLAPTETSDGSSFAPSRTSKSKPTGPPRSGSAFAPAYEPEDPKGKKKKSSDNNLPACFARQPPDDMMAGVFEPMFLTARNSGALREGFPLIPPPSTTRPHPFSTHDVTEEDWTLFVTEMKKTSTLTAGQITKGIVLPYTVWIPGATDYLSYKLRHKYHDENAASAGALVDVWNHHFFGPRSLKAVLLKGKERLSGQLEDTVKGLDLPSQTGSLRSNSSLTLMSQSTAGFDAPASTLSLPAVESGKSGKGKEDHTFRLFVVSSEKHVMIF